MIEQAREFSRTLHKGQLDEHGQAYFNYLESIAQDCFFDEMKAVAYLQDAVEKSDGSVSLKEIRQRFGDEIGDAVDSLTRRNDEAYRDYLLRLKQNPLALGVMLKNSRYKLQSFVSGYSNTSAFDKNFYNSAIETLHA